MIAECRERKVPISASTLQRAYCREHCKHFRVLGKSSRLTPRSARTLGKTFKESRKIFKGS